MNVPTLSAVVLIALFHSSSCSGDGTINTVGQANSNIAQVANNQPSKNGRSQSNQIIEGDMPSNSKDVVVFDGKNYIKKTGWKTPSYDDTYINEDYPLHGKPVDLMTANGKDVQVFSKQYFYNTRPEYSELFEFEGDALDYLKGRLQRAGFFEVRANGKVFMYTIFIRKVQPKMTSSNSGGYEHSNQYQIQDKDGDGLFETLLGVYDEDVVPNWVLK